MTILDGATRARRTIVYSAGAAVPSPIELAQTAAGLRAQARRVSWLDCVDRCPTHHARERRVP